MILVLVAGAAASGCRPDAAEPANVAATSSYLEYAARDILGPGEPILRLAGPGMCPGHFDIRPGQIAELRRCRVLLRFDFQKSLDAKLGNRNAGLRIAAVGLAGGGMCEPASYLNACRQVADALVSAGLLERTEANGRLKEISQRLAAMGDWVKRQIHVSRLAGLPVVASRHQEAFCRYLGLNVVATFSGSDQAGIAELDNAIRAGRRGAARLVIANLPEGRKAADTLAEKLNAGVVVFGNFPDRGAGHRIFDDLITANLKALTSAARK